MARNRRSAYGTPSEAREVVISVDRRLLYGFGLLAAFAIAVAAGVWWTSRPPSVADAPGGTTSAAGTPAADAAGAVQPGVIDEASARGTAAAIGLPTSVAIVQPMQIATEPPAVATADAAPVTGDAYATVRAKITPVNDLASTLLSDPNTIPFEVPEGRKDVSDWGHETLANFTDPNVTDAQYTPVRLEESKGNLDGPRIAISDLNQIYTYDYGVVPLDRPAVHDFKLANVGNADLIVSRVYTACGCTATKIGGQAIDAAGWVPQPLTLKPGQSEVFTVAFDPRAENKPLTQSKYIQIFSNDPTRALFDAQDPNSHEVRFRIVVEPKAAGGQ